MKADVLPRIICSIFESHILKYYSRLDLSNVATEACRQSLRNSIKASPTRLWLSFSRLVPRCRHILCLAPCIFILHAVQGNIAFKCLVGHKVFELFGQTLATRIYFRDLYALA